MTDRILLIEDDADLGAQIEQHLRRSGFEVSWWRHGRFVDAVTARHCSLVILDLMLPDLSGMDILRDLRAISEVPVLVLSARNDTLDKVAALKLGADDYMTKPFWPEELRERVRARLRRPAMLRDGSLSIGPLRCELDSRSVYLHDISIELTRVEFDLLTALAQRAGAAVTRRWLVDHVLDPEREGTERTLDVHMSRLRKKLGEDNPIETVWGIGYRYRLDTPT